MKWKRDKGLLINPKMDKSFKVYVDAYFSGKWCKETESHDEYTEKNNQDTYSCYMDVQYFGTLKYRHT